MPNNLAKMSRTVPACLKARQPQHIHSRAITARRQPLVKCKPISRSQKLHLLTAAALNGHGDDDSAIQPSEAVLQNIRSAVQGSERLLAGAVQLSQAVRVFGQGESAGQPFAVRLPPADAAALQPLLDACIPAKHGTAEVPSTVDNADAHMGHDVAGYAYWRLRPNVDMHNILTHDADEQTCTCTVCYTGCNALRH